jgi:HPt (histidine-containing phosphotransfer) domain-containing protein
MPPAEIEPTTGSQRQTQSAEPAVLALDALRQRCLGNELLVRQILGKIEPAMAAEKVRLEEALEQGNAVALAAVSHRLKGTAANIGAQRLTEAARDLEQYARQHDLTAARDLLADLELQRATLCKTIAELLGGMYGSTEHVEDAT